MITHARLLEKISYDPLTGIFTLREATRRRPIGAVINYNELMTERRAGVPRSPHRRTLISFDGMKFIAGRLAWFYMTGEWPSGEIDHKDTDGWNQVWANLRPATRSQNQANTHCYKSNSSGMKCVHLSGRKKNIWRAQIQKDKRRVSLGYFQTREEALAAYERAAVQLHGEFSRVA